MATQTNRVSDLWRHYEELISEATRKESNDCLLAWLPLPPEKWGKFEILPLTIRRYALLSIEEFWSDENGDPRIPILRFLWVMSPDFSVDPEQAKQFRAKYYFEDFSGFDDRIRSFINKSFEFSPSTSAKKKSSGSTEWISSIVDSFASEYGWSDSRIMDTPLPRLLLLLRRIRERNSENPIKFNSEADRLRQEFMDKVNNN